jgi:hypothetical protein
MQISTGIATDQISANAQPMGLFAMFEERDDESFPGDDDNEYDDDDDESFPGDDDEDEDEDDESFPGDDEDDEDDQYDDEDDEGDNEYDDEDDEGDNEYDDDDDESFPGDDEDDEDKIDQVINKATENPDRQGLIRNVAGAHLVYKREQPDGRFEELWVYNVADMQQGLTTRRAILAGTDIKLNKTSSESDEQYYVVWSVGNGECLNIKGLPN